MKERKKLSLGTTLLLIFLAVVVTFNITFFVAADFYGSKFGDYETLAAKYQKLEEISKVTHTNLSTVKSRLYKGLHVLRCDMKE